MDYEERDSVLLRSAVVFGLVATLTYLIAWDDRSPIYAGDSLGPTLWLWGLGFAVGVGLLIVGRRMLASGGRRRGRPAEVVTWGLAVLIGTGGVVGAALGFVVLIITSGGLA